MSFIQFDNICHIPEEDEEEYEDEDFTISIQELPMDLPEIERTILPPREDGEPEKVEIKISMRKIEADSPLLPIKEDSEAEGSSRESIATPLPTVTFSEPPSSFTTPTNNISRRLSTIFPKASAELSPGHKRYSIPSLLPGSRKLSIGNIAQPLHNLWDKTTGEYQRRKSIPALMRYEKKDEAGYKSPTGRRFTQCYSLYPKDFFWNIEGKPPQSSTKMQAKVDAVGRVTGEWGKWQLRTVLLIFLCKIPSSWFMACIIFTAPAPRHGEFFCKPPSQLGVQNQTLWIKVSHPQKEDADDQEFNIDFCNVYKDAQAHAHHYYRYTDPDDEPRAWEQPLPNKTDVIPCTHFEHRADFHSVITQFDLVCSRDILVSVTQFFHLFGVLTGGILAIHLLKYFSPRNVMLFGMITQIFCGTLTGQVSSYELHVFFRCLSAVCCAQMYTAGGMIMADITGGTYKTCVSTLFEQFWSIGVILLPGVASFFSDWTHLYMAISWPTVILIYLWQWIPDSPRWMVSRGRVLEAKKILIECADVNGTRLSLPYDIDQQLQLQSQTALDAPPPANWWSLWKGERAIRHMICVHLCWSIYIVVYYGMLLNIRSFSREHLEVNTVIAGICEIIGTFIGLALILATTRKWLWTGLFNIIAGLIAYTCWLMPHDIDINSRVALLMLTAMVSKVAISCTLAILTTSTIELVSNEKRRVCAISTICWARFWLLGAPFVGNTVVFGQLVPQTAFASMAIVGGLLSSLISSPPTTAVARRKASQATSNMATATQLNNIGRKSVAGIDNKAFAKGPIFNNANGINPQANLPPELTPDIWTTKMHNKPTI
ncbi:organic cation transporter protein isoform 1-T1 [Glossina fuscipes fuscipes]